MRLVFFKENLREKKNKKIYRIRKPEMIFSWLDIFVFENQVYECTLWIIKKFVFEYSVQYMIK